MSNQLTPEQLAKCRKVFRSKRLSVTNPEIANQWIDDLLDHIEALNATIAARDQWAELLTEQYAAREVQVKAALEYCKGKMSLINKARYIAELLNIPLD